MTFKPSCPAPTGQIELKQMPHHEIILVMELMDKLRADWGVSFPCD